MKIAESIKRFLFESANSRSEIIECLSKVVDKCEQQQNEINRLNAIVDEFKNCVMVPTDKWLITTEKARKYDEQRCDSEKASIS